jgi:hypothetical protein
MPDTNEAVDLRSTIEDAFNANEEGGQAADTTQSVGTPAEKTHHAAEQAREPDTKRFTREDAAGKGDGAVAGKPAAAPADGAGAPGEAQKPVDEFAKAPQSWKPGAREAWGQLSPEVRAEVHRRERESARLVQETAPARQVYQHLSSLQQKYAPALQAEGVDVVTAATNLMDLASRLRFGTPVEKAHLAATIIRNYGVDVNALANALDGQPVQPLHGQSGQPQQGMYQDPRVDALFQQLEQAKQARIEQTVQAATSEVEQFGSDKEFFPDVREDMADLLEVAAKRGIDMSLEQAYDRACLMRPEIAKVLEARKAAENAGTARQSTQRARIAASSVRGTPATASTPKPEDLRGAIEAAFEQVGGR